MLAALHIGDTTWWWPAAAIIALATAILVRAYLRVRQGRSGLLPTATLKLLGLALLAACLVEPLWSSTRAKPGANQFVILVDNSRSLTIQDEDGGETRGEQIADVVARTTPESWSVRLEQDFDVRRYVVGSRLTRAADFETLEFDGAATSINTALQSLADRYDKRHHLAGILLVTDGNVTDLDKGRLQTSDLPPVYPVVVGESDGLQDLRIQNLAIRETAFEDAPVTIAATVRSLESGRDSVTATLYDEDNVKVDSSSQPAGGEQNDTFAYRFRVRPQKTGVAFYTLKVRDDDLDDDEEATLENNEQIVCINRDHRKRRVLYVSGRPNWEFKFLRRAIEGDDQLDLVGLIRVAKREAKFDFRGRAGESSNSIYRGFREEGDEETESYDQPVLVRLNTKDADELRDGFPQAPEELFSFDAVIVDDLESGFFTADQQDLLDRYVSKRGGALLMLGGQESFRAGGYARTPVGRMLPVYLDRAAAIPPGTPFRLEFTRDGMLQPWLRLRETRDKELERLKSVPEFQTVNQLATVKPGATVMAMARISPEQQLPALVVQRFGRGKTAAMTIGDLWRWRLHEDRPADRTMNTDPSDHAKAWRQLLRWLVVDVPQQVDVSLDDAADVAAAAKRIVVRVRDPQFEAIENAGVRVTIRTPGGESVELDAEAGDEAGSYEAVYIPRESGAFRATVTATAPDGTVVDEVETGWASDPARDEFASVEPNRELMSELAKQTGGELVELDGLADFVAGLPTREVPVTETWTWPLWHQSWVFLLAIGCLVGEWGMRRLKGLP